MADTFNLLPPELMCNVVHFVRRDPRGNETIPGFFSEAKTWRRLGRRFRLASREHPSKFNAKDLEHTHGLLKSCNGGFLIGQHMEQFSNQRALLFVRNPSTNRIHCVGVKANDGRWEVVVSHNLKQLMQLLGGHNADFETRLDNLDRVYAGLRVRLPLNGEFQAIDSHYLASCTREDTPTSETKVAFRCIGGVFLPQIELTGRGGFSRVTEVVNGANSLRGVNGLSVVMGYYDMANVAECGGLIVSNQNHGLPRELMPKALANDPEHALRIMARAALDVADRRHVKERCTTLVVCEHRASDQDERRVNRLGRNGGPLAAPASRPRQCTTATRERVKKNMAEINVTHSSGRLHAYTQPWESKEAEKLGFLDDQYANRDDPESEGELQYDSDCEYKPKNPKKPTKERLEEEHERALPDNIARLRQMIMIPSDDEDHYDEDI